jgi:hypothetical protein
VFFQADLAQSRLLFSEALGVMQAEQLAGYTLADWLDWIAAVHQRSKLQFQQTVLNPQARHLEVTERGPRSMPNLECRVGVGKARPPGSDLPDKNRRSRKPQTPG